MQPAQCRKPVHGRRGRLLFRSWHRGAGPGSDRGAAGRGAQIHRGSRFIATAPASAGWSRPSPSRRRILEHEVTGTGGRQHAGLLQGGPIEVVNAGTAQVADQEVTLNGELLVSLGKKRPLGGDRDQPAPVTRPTYTTSIMSSTRARWQAACWWAASDASLPAPSPTGSR